ncbi:MAG: hypothetical protein QW429_01475 [Thermoprotei archaeon]
MLLLLSLLISAVFNMLIGGAMVLILRNKIAEWISGYVVDSIQDLIKDYLDELRENPKALQEFINPILSSLSRGSGGSNGLGVPMVKLPLLGKVPLNVALGLLNNFGLLKPQSPPTSAPAQPTPAPQAPTQPQPQPQVRRKPFLG